MKLRVTLARLAADAAHWGTTRLLHRGGGNIPGTVALRVDPNVVGELSAALSPKLVVTGTNGKTTTTGLLADALAGDGHDVVCNRRQQHGVRNRCCAGAGGREESRARGLL